MSIEAYKSFMQIGETKSNNNPLGTALSLLAQNEERKVISVVIKTFQQNGYTTGTFIHDGFLAESLEVDDQVLRNAELAVKFGEQYDVKLTKKTHARVQRRFVVGCYQRRSRGGTRE